MLGPGESICLDVLDTAERTSFDVLGIGEETSFNVMGVVLVIGRDHCNLGL